MNQAEPSPDPRPTLRLGSYLLLQQLGSGGMSSVFRAVHEETGNIVAVKVLPGDLAKNLILLQRFIREAKSAEALDHPTIVMIYDRGFDRGRHYLVLEYVEGGDLQERVRSEGPLSVEDATRVIRQTAEGLKYAAAKGMIHRDIKPANLLLTPDGKTKIIDLGLALQLSDEDERVTRDGTTVGTVDYMAPEQARDSRKTSVRSDIYSLGCTFHYLLTGKPPYPGGNLADKLTRHVTAPVADPCVLRPDLPEPIGRLARRMMAKKPEDRFADHDHLLRSLDEALADAAHPIVLDALVVDDDDDEYIRRDRPDEPESSGRGYTLAELVALDDEPIRPGAGRVAPAQAIPVVSIAELAELDGPGDADMPGPKVLRPMRPSIAAILEEDEPEAARPPLSRHRGDELPLKTWIMGGIMVGLAIAAIGVAASFLISLVA
ncbi:serine/threonine-protein kinase [Tundrisphaera sp. TA3]|uniref:serine/threonine-protein kinase n=1 Tax=Tundrisphaera sp. TA3 TaxID=3435775 RepID=UPI003EB81C7E